MLVRICLIAVGLASASALMAQSGSTASNAAQASNWDVFQKLYPPRALAAHEEGLVGFNVTLDSQGTVTQCQVTHSSGHPLLDEETCKIITLNAQFKPDPGLSGSQVRTSEGAINWKLPSSAEALPARQAVAQASAPMEKVICKKSIRTGTLGGIERTCMTPREWAKQSEETRSTWDEIQGRKGSTKGN